MSESVLEEAGRIVSGDRADDYGDMATSFGRIAAHWSIILDRAVSPSQVAMCMLALKIVREGNRPKRDNRVDMAGYALCLDVLEGS